MAESAGIVSRGGLPDDTAFAQVLAESPDEVRALARAVRGLVFDVFPQAVEVAWPRQRSVGWGVGPKKFTEQFAYLMPYKAHVTLGFYRGGDLPDPAGLLPAAGGRQVSGTLSMRSLRIEKVEDVNRAAVRALLEAAVRQLIAADTT